MLWVAGPPSTVLMMLLCTPSHTLRFGLTEPVKAGMHKYFVMILSFDSWHF